MREFTLTEEIEQKVDPDPFSIAAVMIAGCTLILQFVQTSKALETAPVSKISMKEARSQMLGSLRSQAEEVSVKLDRTIRAIERGSENPEQQFFEARFRLQQGQLFLSPAHYDQFMRAFSETFTAMGGLGLWIHHVIKHDPELANFLGQQIDSSVGDIAAELNAVIEAGKANSFILSSLRRSIDALLTAIDTAERSQN